MAQEKRKRGRKRQAEADRERGYRGTSRTKCGGKMLPLGAYDACVPLRKRERGEAGEGEAGEGHFESLRTDRHTTPNSAIFVSRLATMAERCSSVTLGRFSAR
jgi:hypothetical protein